MSIAPVLLPVTTLHAQLQALPLLGIDVQQVRAQVGTLPAEPDALVPAQKYVDMWSAAQAQYGMPGLPTALAMAIPFGAFGAIDYLAASADTVAGCMESLVLHFLMVSNDTRLELEALGDGAHAITVRGIGAQPSDALEFTLAVLVSRLRYLTGATIPLRRIGLPVPKPAADEVRTRLLGAPIVYGYPTATLYLEPGSWALPLLRADPYLHATMTRVAQQLQVDRPSDSDLERALRLRLRDALANGGAAPARLAQLLGMSERTLQRRLAAAGQSFSSVVESFQRDEAARLLSDPRLSLVHVANRLGYAEQSSFTRAFRRWTGTTPRAWRTQRGL
jgi:AraC-like DNA-binding protein